MSAGSPRGVSIAGVPYNVAADANIAFGPRQTWEAIVHSGGNMMKSVLAEASAEAVKIIATPSEYSVLKAQSEVQEDITLSVTIADGTVFRTTGRINLDPFQTDDSSVEVKMLTSSGVWDVFAQT